jgi:hypothetical protein
MGVTLTLNGGPETNIVSYSATEDSTPIDPSDSSGGVGQISISLADDMQRDGSILYINDDITLSDGINGTTTGKVNSVKLSNGIADISGDSRVGMFLSYQNIPPFTGTLADAFYNYCDIVGLSANRYVDPDIASIPVNFPGYVGDMWQFMKNMCSAMQIELSLVSNNVVLRPLRSRIAENKRNIDESVSIENKNLAQSVEVYYYNNSTQSSVLVYPKGGWNSSVQIYQVDAGEVLEVNIPVDVYLTSIQQPTPYASGAVPRGYVGPSSTYSVVGKDGVPISATAWTNNGGNLTATIGDDGKSVKVTIFGATDFAGVAPYRIAAGAGDGTYYSTLRLMGGGTFFDKQKATILTGVPASKTATVVGVTVDNPFISTYSQARDVGAIVAANYAGTKQVLNVTTVGINRSGESGSITYPKFSDFDAGVSTITNATGDGTTITYTAANSFTIGQQVGISGISPSIYNTTGTVTFANSTTFKIAGNATGTYSSGGQAYYLGNTFKDFTAQQFDLVKNNFENQAFGNVAGARVKYGDAYYRIRNATITESTISYSAERDTIVNDFDTVWSGKTFAQFDTQFVNKKFEDFGVIPLWQT